MRIIRSPRRTALAVGASLTVDVWEHEGRIFEVVMASDVIRDGMGLELTDLGSSESGPALEAFWHDDGDGFDFISHHAITLPFAVVERFVAHARETLPPTE
jgi:hypothetical protein